MNIEEKVENFKSELRDLLAKYNFSINWSCDPNSDLFNLYDSHLQIRDYTTGKTLIQFPYSEIDVEEIDNLNKNY